MDSVLVSSYHQRVIFLYVNGYCVQDYFSPNGSVIAPML